jgi:hypothetical protein
MSLISRLRPSGSSSPVSLFPTSMSQIIPIHIGAVSNANLRKVSSS